LINSGMGNLPHAPAALAERHAARSLCYEW
jgi:hypothetical protein